MRGRRYWLVGASEGLGRALAHRLVREGIHLVLSARSEDRLRDLAGELSGEAQVMAMDVTDTASVEAAVAGVGEVDGIVWLAGVYWPMNTTTWDVEKSVAMAEVNFTGALRVLGRVVPGMAARGRGHVVITSSLSAFRGLPGAIGYGASKAAVMSLAETMQVDLRGTGVEVQIANPGFIRTRLTERNEFDMPSILEPAEAAEEVFRLMASRRSSRTFPFWFGLVFRISRLLPDWAYLRLFGVLR
jgi:short-subunit dehydrogenase